MSCSVAKRRSVTGSSKYSSSSARSSLGLEAVVDRQVAEVEVAVVHSRVLPVDDAHARAVAHEVGGQQVVVARRRARARGR